ncbi:MAG: porin [Rhodospirillales bacterium]|nr:porin [Rhodospirillales bacterium]
MKKLLLGTTALATAGLLAGVAGDAAAAEKIKIEVHGYMQQFVVGVDQDFNDTDAGKTPQGYKSVIVDEKMNPEICFVGETTLDNGITVGVNVQLEGQLSADYIDEQYLEISSDRFGKLQLGSENGAAYLLSVGAPNGGISIDSGDLINDSFYINTAITDFYDTPAGTTKLRNNDNDSQKITYFTPRFAGFQAGVSYIPKYQPGGGDGNTPNFAANGQHNGVSGGLNYKQKFGDFNVAASGGIHWAQQTSAIDTDGSVEDMTAFAFGAQVGFAGFSVGGAYHNVPSGRQSATTSMKGSSYVVGASYETGPYLVGVEWFDGEADGSIADPSDQKHKALAVSGTYTMGPGVKLVGGFFYFDDSAENNVATQSDTDGWGLTAGFKLSF